MRASFTNGARRERRAQASQRSSSALACSAGSRVELAQLLFEQIGVEQPAVGVLDVGQLRLLAGGQVLGVLPEREAGALELAGELGLAGAPRLVPDLAADLVERIGGELDDVEGIEAQLGLRAALRDRARDPGGHVAGDQLDLPAALFPERVEEPLDRRAVAPGRGPHQPAAVVADDHGQIALALAMRDLI